MPQADSTVGVEIVHQIVVMRREESAALQIGQEVHHSRGDCRPIVCGRSASQLIQQDQARQCGMFENGRRFIQFHQECTVPGHNIVVRTQTRENPIDQ